MNNKSNTEEGTISTSVALFDSDRIRKGILNGKWYFSIIDIVQILTGSTVPKRYWSDLKIKINNLAAS